MLLCAAILAVDARAGAYAVRLAAGSDWVGDGGPAVEAILLQAEGLAVHPNGTLYISDAQTHRVRSVSGGVIRTVAGNGTAGFSGDGSAASAAQLNAPYGLAFDGAGNLYIADLGNARIRRVSPEGIISTVAGGGESPLTAPRDVAVDASGGLFIADFSAQRVFYADAAGVVRTVAGEDQSLDHPAAVAAGNAGVFYVADSGNHRVLKLDHGQVEEVAGVTTPTGLAIDTRGAVYIADAFGSQVLCVTATGASFPVDASGREVAVSGDGTLYASDGQRVRSLSPGGTARNVAGGGDRAHGDGGPAAAARLNRPSGIAVDGGGNLYVADQGNHRVRFVDAKGMITTIAGTGSAGYSGNGGPAKEAHLDSPSALNFDVAGNLYVVDSGNQRLRLVTPFGIIFPLVMIPEIRAAAPSRFGHIYAAAGNRIVNVVPPGIAVEVMNDLAAPQALAVNGDGAVYFIEDGGRVLARRSVLGEVTRVRHEARDLGGIAVAAGGVFVTDRNARQVLAVHADLSLTPLELESPIGAPSAIAAGPDGVLYVAEEAAGHVWSLTHVPVEAVHDATRVSGPIAPGMRLAIRGMKLSQPEVRIGGLPAQLVSVQGLEMVVETPPALAPGSNVLIEALESGELRTTFAAVVVEAAPGLYTSAPGRVRAVNEDGTPNSPAQFAQRGSIVSLLGTGQGVAVLPVTVEIAGGPAEVLYSGPAANAPGLWRIDARIPPNTASIGDVAVRVSVGSASSQVLALSVQ